MTRPSEPFSTVSPPAGPDLLIGEVRTALLQHSVALPRAAAGQLLQLRHGERVRTSERPSGQAVSPDLLTGVDCPLPTASGRAVRGVGTATSRAVLTEGRLLQASVRVRIAATGGSLRLPWGHYLARPGTVEPSGRLAGADLVDGHLSADRLPGGALDLGAIAERLLTDLQGRRVLDRRAPFRSRRTRLLWTATRAEPGGDGPGALFTIEDGTLRTLRLTLERVDPVAVAAFCEDLALHDWLLTTLVQLVERSGLGSAPGPEPLLRLRPAVDHLLHLWMPGARVDRALAPIWAGLETRPGFTRQWAATVQRIRDHLALQAIGLPAHSYQGD
ncbi:hypothetical protein ABH930_003328 [Kitasatospora sp. GAS204A]|nr:hypothetical protein [Kitasatospora sp. GAS204B]